jgi:hypothetical protein
MGAGQTHKIGRQQGSSKSRQLDFLPAASSPIKQLAGTNGGLYGTPERCWRSGMGDSEEVGGGIWNKYRVRKLAMHIYNTRIGRHGLGWQLEKVLELWSPRWQRLSGRIALGATWPAGMAEG